MALSIVEPGTVRPNLNILLYGPTKTGKTVGACSAPGPILYINAEGPQALLKARAIHGSDKIREVVFDSLDILDEVYLHFKDGKAEERTVVIDTAGEVYEKMLELMAGPGPVGIQHHGDAQTKVRRFIRAMRDLPVNFVVIAHEETGDVNSEVPLRPMMGGQKLPGKVLGQFDVVGYTSLWTDDIDNRHYVAQLMQGDGRVAADRTGVLVPNASTPRVVNLTEWIEVGIAGMANHNPAEAQAPAQKEAVAA